jgi:hypothetical protein
MERAVDVGARIRDHRDFADLELGARGVELARLRAAEMIADQRRGNSL